ncbi:hypothetical protein [Bacteroides intestinalis]|jgi:hypothetical protein|uniref:hypothetical protein n=1 Tax=Bacteroides intestinalis TaxID=329854 RepID=UPI00189D2C12|nr:hypothetical protein [Bacteroides intestinalis]
MITNELNTGLVNAVKEKLPSKDNLANALMDILYIGKEAIYRRLRGEVPFTLTEAAVISRKLGISLDKMIGVSFRDNAVFDMNIVSSEKPFEAYYSILEKQVDLFRSVKEDETSEIGTSSNIIPQTLSLKYNMLSKFRLFKWMYQNENIKCKHFEEMEIPQKMVEKQKEYSDLVSHIHSVDYIWDNMIFSHLVNDIQYFCSIHLITDEDKDMLKEELFLLIDEMEELSARGKSKAGNDVKIYISNINFEATYSYLDTSSTQLSLIRIYSINSITTQDQEMFRGLKEWIQSLKKFSTLISESGEMQRIQFFKQQREIVSIL